MLFLSVKSLMRLRVDINKKDKNVLSIIKQKIIYGHTFSHVTKQKQLIQYFCAFVFPSIH